MPYTEAVPGKLDIFRMVHPFAWRPRRIDGTWCWLEYYVTLEFCGNAEGRWVAVSTARTRDGVLHRPVHLPHTPVSR